jgi:pyridoxal phosphate enzyme (YggS family)
MSHSEDSSQTFSSRLAQVEESIAAACRHAGRRRESVQLMAVSKTHPAAAIAEAVAAGLTLFGENRVQEFQQKAQDLKQFGIQNAEVHLIGHLQSNKTGKAAEIFAGVDTVDSLRLAERLQEAAARMGRRLPVLLEIKLSNEEAKTGLHPESDETRALLERLPDLTALKMRGLMTVAPLTGDEAVTRDCFRRLRRLRDGWSAAHPRLNFEELSMGMSGDFAIAIEEGSTCIRIGMALFGRRERRE